MNGTATVLLELGDIHQWEEIVLGFGSKSSQIFRGLELLIFAGNCTVPVSNYGYKFLPAGLLFTYYLVLKTFYLKISNNPFMFSGNTVLCLFLKMVSTLNY